MHLGTATAHATGGALGGVLAAAFPALCLFFAGVLKLLMPYDLLGTFLIFKDANLLLHRLQPCPKDASHPAQGSQGAQGRGPRGGD